MLLREDVEVGHQDVVVEPETVLHFRRGTDGVGCSEPQDVAGCEIDAARRAAHEDVVGVEGPVGGLERLAVQ